MLRVAMLVSNRHDPDPRVQKEAEALLGAGFDVTIYAFDRRHELPLTGSIGGIPIRRIRTPAPVGPGLLSTARGLAYFKNSVRHHLLRAPAHVVHCHDQDTCSVGSWWKRKGANRAGLTRGYFVFDAHDLYWTWALLPNPDSAWRKMLARWLKARNASFARAADLVITVTRKIGEFEGTAEIYERLGCRTVVVWNAPLPAVRVPDLPDTFTVGYFGNVREIGMFVRLLSAIERLPAAERPALSLAGAGRVESEVRKIFETTAPRLGITFAIESAFTMADVPRLMSTCTVQYCVYPTKRGNISRAMPVKMLEAVAYGRKVIGNADTLMGEWITSNGWGWTVAENDVDGLAEILRTARAADAAEQRRAPSLLPPPLWPEQARTLVDAYQDITKQ